MHLYRFRSSSNHSEILFETHDLYEAIDFVLDPMFTESVTGANTEAYIYDTLKNGVLLSSEYVGTLHGNSELS